MRDVLVTHGGVEVEHEGDAFMLAFTGPASAVRFAVELQRALERATAARDRSAVRVRVRVGMTSGDVIADEHGYFGRTSLRASQASPAEARSSSRRRPASSRSTPALASRPAATSCAG